MNTRLAQLWEQGTFNVVPRAGDFSSVSANNIEKFAELIIQECTTIIAMVGIANTENDQYGDIAWTVQTSLELIKEKLLVNKCNTS